MGVLVISVFEHRNVQAPLRRGDLTSLWCQISITSGWAVVEVKLCLLEPLLLPLLCLYEQCHIPFVPFQVHDFLYALNESFTVQTYFQGSKADSCTLSFSSAFSSSPHLWFPLGSGHLALLLSEVVIYKHQFVSTDQGLAASLTTQLVQIKTMCVTVCDCVRVCVFLS